MQDRVARPPRTAAKIVLSTCLAYLLALLVVSVTLWTLADRWWPATVLSFAPLWMLAAPLIPLLALSLLWHRRSLFTLLAAAVVLIWPIMGFQIPWSRISSEDHAPFLRVMTCNMHRAQLNVPEFQAVLRDLHPDVVAIQDWKPSEESELFPPEIWNTRRNGELFLASRYPFIQTQPIRLAEPSPVSFNARRGAAACYRLHTPLGDLNLINLHLSSPHAALEALQRSDPGSPEQLIYNSRCREMESAAITQFIDQLDDPILIMGDFNTPRESVIYRHYWDQFTNAFSSAGFGFGTTHFTTASSLRIDHILFGKDFRARACWIGPPVGSPHRPVVADLVCSGDLSSVDARADAGR